MKSLVIYHANCTDVIIAWAEGEDVQVWDDINDMWCDLTLKDPNFRGEKYRIKPPAKKYRVGLFRKYKDNEPLVVAVNSQVTADSFESMPNFIRWLTDWIEYEEWGHDDTKHSRHAPRLLGLGGRRNLGPTRRLRQLR